MILNHLLRVILKLWINRLFKLFIDAAGAMRAIETIKREKVAAYEAPRGFGGEAFRARRAGCQQDQNHHCQPCKHTEPPVTFSDNNLLLVSRQ